MTDHTIVLYDSDKSRADLLKNQVAEAIALVDYEIKQSQSMVNIFANMRLAGILQDGNLNEVAHEKNQYRRFLNSWLTHKAEFGEHERTGYSEQETDEDFCEKCEGPYQKNILYPCNFITTKAKRLLGRE